MNKFQIQQMLTTHPILNAHFLTYSTDKQEQFYTDFSAYETDDLANLLNEFEHNLVLLDIWAQCSEGVKESRTQLAFLQTYFDLNSTISPKGNVSLKEKLIRHCRGIRKNAVGGHSISITGDVQIRLTDENALTRQISDITADSNGVRKLPTRWKLDIGDFLRNPDHTQWQPPTFDWKSKNLSEDGHTFFPIHMTEEEIFEQFVSAFSKPTHAKTAWGLQNLGSLRYRRFSSQA